MSKAILVIDMPVKMLKTGEGWVNGWNAAIGAIGGKDSDGE